MESEGPGLVSFFTEMDLRGHIVVRDSPKFDLEPYIQNYTGRTRFERLLHIGKTCVPLGVEALKLAIAEAKSGRDVGRYREAWECLKSASPNDPEATFDQQWADRVEKENKAETKRLEAQLKGYSNNLIKESIRMGNEDLGRHFESMGNYQGAAEAYTNMRADVSTSKHIVDVGKHLAEVSMQRRDFTAVLGNLAKIMGVHTDEDKELQPYIKVLHGVTLMEVDKYDEATSAFLQVQPLDDKKRDLPEYSSVASPNDVAIYGGLLSLATVNRADLQTRVLENQSFRSYLELEPHIRKAISLYVNGRYSACLAILESYRTDFLLDVHLWRHVESIYNTIRGKCIVQYFAPFSCVTLSSLNDAFGVPGKDLQKELVDMIKKGTLQARINTMDGLLVAVSPNQRLAMQARALETTKTYERESIDRIRRMSLSAAGLEVRNVKKMQMPGAPPPASESGGNDAWFDNAGEPMGTGTAMEQS